MGQRKTQSVWLGTLNADVAYARSSHDTLQLYAFQLKINAVTAEKDSLFT